MLQRSGPFGHAGHPESGGRRPRNWHGASKFSLLVPLLLGGWVPGADAFSKTAGTAASGCERGRCTAESVLCDLTTYVLANGAPRSSDSSCQLWLDAGHNCSTQWKDLCTIGHPDVVSFPDGNPSIYQVKCSQCFATLSPPLPPSPPPSPSPPLRSNGASASVSEVSQSAGHAEGQRRSLAEVESPPLDGTARSVALGVGYCRNASGSNPWNTPPSSCIDTVQECGQACEATTDCACFAHTSPAANPA